jgi:DNA-binding transcriptional regulator GbsR (MarR family)
MSDIVKRLEDMFFRFGTESPDDAAKRRIQTAKDAADEIEKLRAELNQAVGCIEDANAERDAMKAEIEKLRAALNKISKLNARRDRYSQEVEDVIIAALGEKE